MVMAENKLVAEERVVVSGSYDNALWSGSPSDPAGEARVMTRSTTRKRVLKKVPTEKEDSTTDMQASI